MEIVVQVPLVDLDRDLPSKLGLDPALVVIVSMDAKGNLDISTRPHVDLRTDQRNAILRAVRAYLKKHWDLVMDALDRAIGIDAKPKADSGHRHKPDGPG